MYEHIENLKFLYGNDAYVQIPNDIFNILSFNIKNKNGSTNIQQSSFAYSYLVLMSFLYKYAHFVDIDNNTYIQNADIKELLGYSKTTKSIDHIIKKGGVLDSIGLTNTIKNYPIRFIYNPNESINGIPVREFIMINELNKDDLELELIKKVVKNRNYEIKEPIFLFNRNEDIGTLYDYSNTHTISINEIIHFITDSDLDNIDFYIYSFLKSRCKGLNNDSASICLQKIAYQLGISNDTFYSHLNVLKGRNFIRVNHKGWISNNDESNDYKFIGLLNF